MRALYTLAATLGVTVAQLTATLSAQEFARWQVWLAAEQRTPAAQAAHHAQLLAAAHNGGAFQRKGGGAWTPADFERPDPWVAARELTPEQMAERLAREYQQLAQQMGEG